MWFTMSLNITLMWFTMLKLTVVGAAGTFLMTGVDAVGAMDDVDVGGGNVKN